jgi:tRNA A37 threonylcarbamoyladenosine dehydratase
VSSAGSFVPVAEVSQRRFGGLDRLYGAAGAARIAQAHVAIVGIGGVGSWAAEALARSGVGELTLIDLDHIAESNVNRQVHALDSTLGQAKVHAMRERIGGIHPGCVVHCVEEFVEPGNWPEVLQGAQVDGVIDACDQVHAKAAMAAWARSHKQLFIASGAAGGKRLAHRIEVADLAQVTHDPLLAQLRYRMRKHHAAPRAPGKDFDIACVFSREAVAPPDISCTRQAHVDGTLNCHGYGSTVAVTASFGLCAAGWIMDVLAKQSKNV